MARLTQIKNMMSEVNLFFEVVLTCVLKEKYTLKALAVLKDEKVQEYFTQVIDDKMPQTPCKKRDKKDPTAPKKNCSSYIFFGKDARAGHHHRGLKAKYDDWNGKQVASELDRIWREKMGDEDKEPYIKQATQEKECTPSPEWLASIASDSESSSSGGKKRSKKKHTGPKRSMSTYLYFCQAMRKTIKDENDGMSAKEVTAELGRIWREEVKEDKKASRPYRKLVKKDNARYEEEKTNWVPEPGDAKLKDGESLNEQMDFKVLLMLSRESCLSNQEASEPRGVRTFSRQSSG